MKRAAFALILALLPALAAAQEPSLIQKTGKTLEKVADKVMEPIRDPKAAVSTWFDYDPQIQSGQKTNFNILPLFVSSPERGIGFGVKFARESLFKKHDILHAQAIHTLKNKASYRLNYEFPSVLSGLGGEFEIGYENYGRFYYGIGNAARNEDESEYNVELWDAKLPLLYSLTDKIGLGVSVGFENWKMTETGRTGILPRDLPGLVGRDRTRIYTSGLLARWDTRNSKSDPSEGLFFEGAQEYSKKLLGSESDFTRTTADLRAFTPLFWNADHVFGVRVFMDYKTGDVPFYHLPQLGGIYFNRGLIEGRFRDNLSFTGNWEYRVRIYQRLHWAFFVDAGNVYREFKYVAVRQTKITGGTGMRYYVPPGNLLLARIDGGYSTEGLQIYLTFDHPF